MPPKYTVKDCLMRSARYVLCLGLISIASIGVPGSVAAKKVTTETITIVPSAEKADQTPLKPNLSVDQVIPKTTQPTHPPDDEQEDNSDSSAAQSLEAPLALPEVQIDLSALPAPVRATRDAILKAARTGDIERLRPVLEANEVPPTLSFGGYIDPIDFLKQSSGDTNGHELLAILIEILETGYVHLDKGQPQEMFIWPYFFSIPLDDLTPPQRVDLFKIITYGDYEDMKQFGAYIFYRLGIGPDGTWHFFVAGD